MRRLATLVILAVFAQACGVHYLAAPPLPPQVAPPVVNPDLPPAQGETLVTLDVVGEAARVDRIVGRQQYPQVSYGGRGRYSQTLVPGLQTVPLCQAPCVVSLPPGDHELQFAALDPGSTSTSTAFVRVGRQPLLVRHAMGYREEHVGQLLGAILLGSLGFSASLTGGLLVGIDRSLPPEQQGMATIGWSVLGVGAAAAAAAIWLGLNSETTVQPGATAIYPLTAPN
ncbi:MAG: hypothetical protein HY902_17695 [Deltaproteobacteria bacterium]|nr:hypothetical protein [Deltaproteobacteria bacterium]